MSVSIFESTRQEVSARPVFQSKWGWHVCDYKQFKLLKKIGHLHRLGEGRHRALEHWRKKGNEGKPLMERKWKHPFTPSILREILQDVTADEKAHAYDYLRDLVLESAEVEDSWHKEVYFHILEQATVIEAERKKRFRERIDKAVLKIKEGRGGTGDGFAYDLVLQAAPKVCPDAPGVDLWSWICSAKKIFETQQEADAEAAKLKPQSWVAVEDLAERMDRWHTLHT